MKARTILITFLLIYSGFTFCTSAGKTQTGKDNKPGRADTSKAAIIELSPASFEIPKPDGQFITEVLRIKNTGNDTLLINRVEGSCYCASSTVLNSKLEPGGEGKIMLYVNMKGMYDDKDIVQFIIYSNAKNPLVSVNLTILPAIKDSTKTKEKNN